MQKSWGFLWLLVLILTAGCYTRQPPERPVPVGLRPGDAVRVDIWQEEDLTGEYLVDANGRVVFPMLGERDVRGIEATELETRLTTEYREYLENPSVRVIALRRIAILGQVRSPGLFMVDATVTLTDALAMAGGINEGGSLDNIRLIRNGEVIVKSMDVTKSIDVTPIESGDQIDVGPRGWAYRNRYWVSMAAGFISTVILWTWIRR